MLRTLLALAAVFGCAGGVSAAPIMANQVDNFTNQQLVVDSVGGSSTSGSLMGLDGVLGGTRNITVNAGVTGSTLLGARVVVDLGNLTYSTDGGVTGSFLLEYPDAGPLDLATAISFSFDIDQNDNGGSFTLSLFDGVNTKMSLLTVGSNQTGMQNIALAGNTDFNGVDLGSVQSISLLFQGNLNTDLVLSPLGFQIVRPVPEPATLATFGLLGLFGGYAVRRRLKTSSVAQA